MRRHLLTLCAFAALTSPAEAATKYFCVLSGSTVTIPSDWGTPNEVDALGAGGGGGPPKDTNNRGWGSGGGGAPYAVSTNLSLTPGATLAVQIGVGGIAGIIAYTGLPSTSPSDGSPTFLCQTSSCPGGLTDTNTVVGSPGGLGGFTSTGDNWGLCANAVFNSTCYQGGNGAGNTHGASGAGAAAMPVASSRSGDGGLGYFNNLIGAFGGGQGGCAGQQTASNGGFASGGTGGTGCTPSAGGGQGGNGGTSSGASYGSHGTNGTRWESLAAGCGGPGGGGGASSADNTSLDPFSSTGNPDGGTGAGGGTGDLGLNQASGHGGNGELFFIYTPTTLPALITSQAFIY